MPECACGCGKPTGGGEFLPGHDQKVRTTAENTVGGVRNLHELAMAAYEHAKGRLPLEELGRLVRRIVPQ